MADSNLPLTPPPASSPPAESFGFFDSQATTVVRLSPCPQLLDEDEDMYRNEEDIKLQRSIAQSIIKSIEEEEDVGMMIEAQLSPRTDHSDHDQYLRGGGSPNPNNLTSKMAITYVQDNARYRPSPEELEEDEDEDDEYGDYEDYEDLEEYEGSAAWRRKIDEMDVDDDDNYSTSSNWDDYGNLPVVIGEYEEILERIEGSEDWNPDQKKLHKLIYLRGLMPMIPSHWRLCFKMWGITAPNLDDVFTPKTSRKRVAIHAYGSVQHAGKALESLFYLSQYVTDYEELGLQEKSAPLVAKTLRNYIKWSVQDAGLDYRKNPPIVVVQDYQRTFGLDSDDSQGDGSHSSDEELELSDEYTEEDRNMQRFVRALDRDLEARLRYVRRQWHERLWDRKTRTYIAPIPTLYGLAVVQHIVGVVTLCPSGPKKPIVVIEQIKLNDRGQWLWNALSLALPIHLARDALYNLRDTGLVYENVPDPSDPDL